MNKENTNKIEKIECIKLDEILKSLFTVSNKVLINMINTIFHENYSIKDTTITQETPEFTILQNNVLKSDLILELKSKKKTQNYHIKFQTKNDKTSIKYMFEYDLLYAKQKYYEKRKQNDEKIVFHMPEDIIIFIGENNIPNHMDIKIVLPDEQEKDYEIPVMKCSQYSTQEMIQNKLYPLLPLQLFNFKEELLKLNKEKTENKNKIDDQMQKVMQSAKQTAEEIIKLQESGKINPEDMHILLLAISNLFKYLNSKYGNDTKLNKKVNIIIKTLYDSIVEERGIKIGEIKGIISTCIEFKLEDDEIINKLKSNLNLDDEKANKYLNNYYKENKK